MQRSGDELRKRVAVALIGIPVAVILAYLGGYWLAAFLALMAGLAAWEFCAMYRQHGLPAAPSVAGPLALAYVLIAAGLSVEGFAMSVAVMSLGVGAAMMIMTPPASRPGLTVMVTVFAAAYTGLSLAFAVWLRALGGGAPGWHGAAVLFLPVAVTWFGDTAAYFGGRAFGRRKLAPAISPAKTWEGAIAGFLAAAGGALLYAELTRSLVTWTLSWGELLGFGVAVALAGQVGDLFESRFKRDCGVKDSSALLPGHGGILDRLDSLLFVFPVGYAYLRLTGL
ncbi:MAG: phosphatidate cytidylyltransferase [Gemmatimonadota bacterium]|nr:MAG: phosphatidate cytidylyltransferase [Gemmatimonadota bacterium]